MGTLASSGTYTNWVVTPDDPIIKNRTMPRMLAIGILVRASKRSNKDTFFRYGSMAVEYIRCLDALLDEQKLLVEQRERTYGCEIPAWFKTIAGCPSDTFSHFNFEWRSNIDSHGFFKFNDPRTEYANSLYKHGIVYIAHCNDSKSFEYIIDDYKHLKTTNEKHEHLRYVNHKDFPFFLVIIETHYEKYQKYNKNTRNDKFIEYFANNIGRDIVNDIPPFEGSFAMINRKQYRQLQLYDCQTLINRYSELANQLLPSFHQKVYDFAYKIDVQRYQNETALRAKQWQETSILEKIKLMMYVLIFYGGGLLFFFLFFRFQARHININIV